MITVIGGSSCGLYSAWRLRKAGYRVTIYEKELSLQPLPRRLIVTPYLLQLIPIPEDLILHRVTGFEFFANGYRSSVRLKNPDIIIDRKELINWLAAETQQSGVEIKHGWQFSGFNHHSNGETSISLKNLVSGDCQEVSPETLIASDGTESSVSEALGRSISPVFLVQAKVSLPPKHPPGLAQIWFRKEVTPYFFWLFPDSPRTGVVGVIMEKNVNAREALDDFINQMGWEALEYESGYSSLYLPELQPEIRKGNLRILFVGDALGQVKVTTIGGTVTGLRGAEACVNAIVKRKSYSRELAPLRKELKIHFLIRRFLNRLDDESYSEVLSFADKRKSFLESVSRDEFSAHLFSLLLKPHSIFFKAARAMITGSN